MSNVQKYYKSLTRSMYDDCAYKRRITESTDPLLYNINPVAYESCNPCNMYYPGFIRNHASPSFGFGIGPKQIDVDSDLRRQTRLLTNCPSHKYNPLAYNFCGACEKCDKGLPCGCGHCSAKNAHAMNECQPGIVPIEALDTRSFKMCNSSRNQFLENQYDILCHNPQNPARIFRSPSARTDLGQPTQQNMKDYVSSLGGDLCKVGQMPRKTPCSYGGMGCANLDQFGQGIFQ